VLLQFFPVGSSVALEGSVDEVIAHDLAPYLDAGFVEIGLRGGRVSGRGGVGVRVGLRVSFFVWRIVHAFNPSPVG